MDPLRQMNGARQRLPARHCPSAAIEPARRNTVLKPRFTPVSMNRALLFCFTFLAAASASASGDRPGRLAPVLTSRVQPAPWGVQFNPLAPHIHVPWGQWSATEMETRIDRLVGATAELGAAWVRFSVDWANVEDTAGGWHWELVDRSVEGLTARGVQIILCVNGGHPAHTATTSVRGPEEMRAWREFVGRMAERYGGRIRHWEVWNEPNTVWFWKPAPSAREYSDLLRETAQLIRSRIPDAVILGGSVARLDLDFARELVALGAGGFCDVFSIHPYGEQPEAILRPVRLPVRTPHWYIEADHAVEDLRRLLGTSGVRIWQDECGYPSAANSQGWTGNGPWGERIQAKWLLRRLLTDVAFGSEVSCYFALADHVAGSPDRYNSKGLLRLDTLEPKPAFRAFQHLAAVVHGPVIAVPRTEAVVRTIGPAGSFPGAVAADVLVAEFQAGGARVLAWWLPWRAQEQVSPASAELSVQGFTDPVLVDLLSGEVTTAAGAPDSGLIVPVADWPWLLVERSSLPPLSPPTGPQTLIPNP